MTQTGLVPIAYTFSVLNRSISLGTPGGNKSSKISDVEKHHPCASQTSAGVDEDINSCKKTNKIT